MTAPSDSVRVGILGAARIAELAIVKPARETGTRLVVIGARDRRRAELFAHQHGVERGRRPLRLEGPLHVIAFRKGLIEVTGNITGDGPVTGDKESS